MNASIHPETFTSTARPVCTAGREAVVNTLVEVADALARLAEKLDDGTAVV